MRQRDKIDTMWVKICGNTNLEDAALAAELGADAVGFVFAESKRRVTAAQVGAITSHLPAGIERVGVFSSHDADEIVRTVSDAGLTTVQLHGGLDQHLLDHLAAKFAGSVRMMQTLHWTIDKSGAPYAPPRQTPAEDAPHQPTSVLQLSREIELLAAQGIVDRVLIDSKVGAADGGTGVAYDWSAARTVLKSAPITLQFVIAGGLKASNVALAIELLAPWGVDVSSGVEASPGKKDPTLVARFIENARRAQTP